HEVRGITHLGGTILGTSSRGDPLKWRVQRLDGSWEERDRTQELLDSFRAHRLDALIAIGGEGTRGIVHGLWKKGLPVVGVPKTIDNDGGGTSSTVGFDTAVATATDALGQVHSTAERQFVMMFAFQPPGIVAIPLEKAIANPRRVPLDSDTITTARDLGISFGD